MVRLDLDAPCPDCGHLFKEHRMVHPWAPGERAAKPRVLCPLCGGKMHRKGTAWVTFEECAWRQFCRDTGRLNPDADPANPSALDVPDRREVPPAVEQAYLAWKGTRPEAWEAGEVPAARILRQRRAGVPGAAQ